MSLRKTTITSLSWVSGARVLQVAGQFVITAILARLLSPEEFGLLGMVTFFSGLALIFSETGFTAALIQNQHLDERHYSTVFYVNLVFGTAATGLFLGISPLLALFYDTPELTSYARLIAVSFIVSSTSVVQLALARKAMQFKKLAIIEVVSVFVSGTVAIVMALRGYGVWALVAQRLLNTAVFTFSLWVFSKWRPRLLFDFGAFKTVWKFSSSAAGSDFLDYVSSNIDYLLIGKFLGTEALGIYTLAYKIMLFPIINVSSIISKVMLPALSKIQHDLAKVRSAYIKLIRMKSFVTFPLILGLLALCPEFVNLVYGEKWEGLVFVLSVLCFCGMAKSIGINVGVILHSQGKAPMQLRLDFLHSVMIVAAIFIGIGRGINGVAVAYTAFSILYHLISIAISNRQIELADRDFAGATLPVLAVTVAMALVVYGVKMVLPFAEVTTFGIAVAAGILSYGVLVLLFFRDSIRRILRS